MRDTSINEFELRNSEVTLFALILLLLDFLFISLLFALHLLLQLFFILSFFKEVDSFLLLLFLSLQDAFNQLINRWWALVFLHLRPSLHDSVLQFNSELVLSELQHIIFLVIVVEDVIQGQWVLGLHTCIINIMIRFLHILFLFSDFMQSFGCNLEAGDSCEASEISVSIVTDQGGSVIDNCTATKTLNNKLLFEFSGV